MLEAWAPNVRLGEQVAVEGTSLWKVMKLMKRRKSHRMICCVESWLCARYSIRGTKFTVSLTMYYQVSHAFPPSPFGSYSDVSEDQWCKYRDDRGWVRQEFLEVTGTVSALILPPQRQDSRLAAAEPAICWKNPLYWAHSKFMMLDRFINRHLMSIPQCAAISECRGSMRPSKHQGIGSIESIMEVVTSLDFLVFFLKAIFVKFL